MENEHEEFINRTPEKVTLAIFDMLKVKLEPWAIKASANLTLHEYFSSDEFITMQRLYRLKTNGE